MIRAGRHTLRHGQGQRTPVGDLLAPFLAPIINAAHVTEIGEDDPREPGAEFRLMKPATRSSGPVYDLHLTLTGGAR